MAEKWKNVQSNMVNGVIYGVMRNPKNVMSKSHVRLSPEVFVTKEQAKITFWKAVEEDFS